MEQKFPKSRPPSFRNLDTLVCQEWWNPLHYNQNWQSSIRIRGNAFEYTASISQGVLLVWVSLTYCLKENYFINYIDVNQFKSTIKNLTASLHFFDGIHFDDNRVDIKKTIFNQAFGVFHKFQNVLCRILIFQREIIFFEFHCTMICSVVCSC